MKQFRSIFRFCTNSYFNKIQTIFPEIEKSLQNIEYKENQVLQQDYEIMKLQKENITKSIGEGNFEQGLKESYEHLEKTKNSFGINHPAFFSALNYCALIYKKTGQFENAENIYQYSLKGYDSLFGLQNPSTIVILQNLATLYREMKQFEKSLELFQQVLSLQDDKGNDAFCKIQMAGCYRELQQFQKSEEIIKQSLIIVEEHYGKDSLIYATCQNNLGLTYKKMKNYKNSEQSYSICLNIREKHLSQFHPDLIAIHHNLSELYLEQQMIQEAEEHIEYVMKGLKDIQQL